MKGICRGEIRAKESKLADFLERGCTKCGRLDFILVKKMEIKSGFTLWNLVFLLMVSCVKGRVVFEGYIFRGPSAFCQGVASSRLIPRYISIYIYMSLILYTYAGYFAMERYK